MGTAVLAAIISFLLLISSARIHANPESGLTNFQYELYLSLNAFKDNQFKQYKDSKLPFPSDTELKEKWEDFKSTQIKIQSSQSSVSMTTYTISFVVFLVLFATHFLILKKQRKN